MESVRYLNMVYLRWTEESYMLFDLFIKDCEEFYKLSDFW